MVWKFPLTGQYTTLIVLHKDAPGTIAAVTEVMAEEGINICNFRLSRQKKGGEAVMTIDWTENQVLRSIRRSIRFPISIPALCCSLSDKENIKS